MGSGSSNMRVARSSCDMSRNTRWRSATADKFSTLRRSVYPAYAPPPM
jgi:hypothetical protein